MSRQSSLRAQWAAAAVIALVAGLHACGGGGDGVSPGGGSVTLDRSSVNLVGIGVSVSVQATVSGNAAVTWHSTDETVVRVSSSGKIASLVSQAPGTASVTATVGTASATLPVTVVADVNSITVSHSALALTVDDENAMTVNATAVADPGVTVSLTWASGNTNVATVAAGSNGASAIITAVGVGSATVTLTARTQFGTTRAVSIPVVSTMAVRAVILSDDKTDLGMGRSHTLGLRVTGDPAFPKTVTWTSANTAVVSVESSGRLTAITPGLATVHARSTADPAIRDSVIVLVTDTPFSLSDFALIPAGTFLMGTDGVPDQPVHQVTLTRLFLIQRTEVTQSQWQRVMGDNPSHYQQCGGDCPVEQVSWNDVEVFIARLNERSPGITYRLPTEAEWEYAARAGSAGPWHGPLDAIGWIGFNSSAQTHQVGLKQPNAWGLYDAIGNVGEWVQDFWAPPLTSTQPVTDPTGPASGTFRTSRGENYTSQIDLTRPHTNRGGGIPNSSSPEGGVRLARSP